MNPLGSIAFSSATIAVISSLTMHAVDAHGRLLDPPHRGWMFKAGFTKIPANFDDNGLNAGGTSATADGKHGVCGDPFSAAAPRPHETGGKYGLFPTLGKEAIAKCYKPGTTITVKTQLTANHLGYIRYQLCPLKAKEDRETEECFTNLKGTDGKEQFPVVANQNDYTAELQLPNGVTCEGDSHCVMRWWYRGGNNAGGDKATQEEFWNCADIWISNDCERSSTSGGNTTSPTTKPADPYPVSPTTVTPTAVPGPAPGPVGPVSPTTDAPKPSSAVPYTPNKPATTSAAPTTLPSSAPSTTPSKLPSKSDTTTVKPSTTPSSPYTPIKPATTSAAPTTTPGKVPSKDDTTANEATVTPTTSPSTAPTTTPSTTSATPTTSPKSDTTANEATLSPTKKHKKHCNPKSGKAKRMPN